jgi:hypothetical protein
MSLRDCLDLHGRLLDREDRDRIRQISNDRQAHGASAEDANRLAVRQVLEDAEDDAADVRQQLARQGVSAPLRAIRAPRSRIQERAQDAGASAGSDD